ncbi:MAG TPA: trypsin-like serine protease [Kofleriaceae bacterium]|nr:trypsin-like serine protease [Kofleriaceae bacterium]
MSRSGLVFVALLNACALTPEDGSGSESYVVGGQPESGYAPVGYLTSSLYAGQYKTICGVTLIAPKVVVTASHCVAGEQASTLSVGFGAVGTTPTIPVAAIHTHPAYVYRSEGDYAPWDDVAVVELAAEVPNIAPATIARAHTGGCDDRYVGYGRNTEGDSSVLTGYDGQRRSAAICSDAQNPHELYIHGRDGGLCWGDSGGPLLVDGTTKILGVLSRHAPRDGSHYSCETGNRMIFSQLATYRELISQWAPDAFEPEPTPPPTTVGWCNLQWPPQVHAQRFAASDGIYGRVWIDGVTQGRGQGAGVLAEVGFGPKGSSPDASAGWIWHAAHYNVDADGLGAGDLSNDEYAGTVMPFASGTYDVAYRFSLDGARTWKTCGPARELVVP